MGKGQSELMNAIGEVKDNAKHTATALRHNAVKIGEGHSELMKKFDAIIVRCNPGQIKQDGGDQQKFDDSMREMRKLGKQVWPSPDVMEKMGAKDALCKVAKLNIGLEDTLAYYDEAEFAAGFK